MTAVKEQLVDEVGMEQPLETAIQTSGLRVGRGDAIILRDLSLCIPQGVIYGLTGPSGAGKSTLLRVLATVVRPDGGTIRVDGIDPADDRRAVRARIGYLPDRFGVYEALTVREYLSFYAALYGVPPRRRHQVTDELLELFRLTDERDRPVGALSRGLRQQLGMARCLVHDPRIVLLDEPAAGMDPQARLELRDILRELAGLGKTVLIGSNLLEDLAETCTHIGLMRAGQMVTDGETDEVLEEVVLHLTGEANGT